jgi:hypothetical protein
MERRPHSACPERYLLVRDVVGYQAGDESDLLDQPSVCRRDFPSRALAPSDRIELSRADPREADRGRKSGSNSRSPCSSGSLQPAGALRVTEDDAETEPRCDVLNPDFAPEVIANVSATLETATHLYLAKQPVAFVLGDRAGVVGSNDFLWRHHRQSA